MFHTPTTNKATNIRVVELALIPTGTYKQQFSRPYTMDLTPSTLNQIANTVEAATSMGQSITPLTISTMGSTVVAPAANHHGAVNIINGWDIRRLRFRLIVEVTYSVGGSRRFYYTGYTDHGGLSYGNALDPNLVFYINSIISARSIRQETPMGSTIIENIERGRHLLCDNNWGGALETNQTYLMRPEDIYNSMAMEHTKKHASSFLDTRNMVQRNVLESNIANGLPNNYVANVLDGFVKATMQSSLTSVDADIFGDARRLVNGVSDPNPLITAVSNLRGFNSMGNTFTLEELHKIDQFMPPETFYQLTAMDEENISRSGSSAEWYGSDGNTVNAVSLSQSIPAIMSSLGIQNIAFMSTNDTVGCLVNTRVAAMSTLDAQDKQRKSMMFITRFDSEVIPVISFNNMLRYFISGEIDLFGDAKIAIGINGEQVYEYTMPAFAGNLVSPVVSKDAAHTQKIITDFSSILHHIRDMSDNLSTASPSLFTPNLV